MKRLVKKKKYNRLTKGYKIDIFASTLNDTHYLYISSTDFCKTCKEAIKRFKELNFTFCLDKKIKANFDYDIKYV